MQRSMTGVPSLECFVCCLQALKEELDAAQADLDTVHETGEELVGLVGEPEKPEVEKNVDDVDTAWDGLNKQWVDRQNRLDDALRKATSFQDELMVRVCHSPTLHSSVT